MLGGPEMSQAIGQLAFNRLTEFLPILGAYTVPSSDFTMPLTSSTSVTYNCYLTPLSATALLFACSEGL